MFAQFRLFLGEARLRALFLLIATTGLTSLVLNTLIDEYEWVQGVQSALVLIAIVGGALIVGGRLDGQERARWVSILLPAVGAILLALFVLPQYSLALSGAAAGWIVAALFLFRTRTPTEIARAVKAFRKSNYAEAVKQMDTVIREQPKTAAHYIFRAEIYRVWGKLDKARRDYARVVELEPRSPMAHNGLSEVYLQSGDFLKAQESAKRAVELAPTEWVAFYNLGMIQDRLADSQAVIAHLERALQFGVKDKRHRLLIRLYLARASARLGDNATAETQRAAMDRERSGLGEWEKLIASDQAETLRAVLGADIATAGALLRGEMTVEALSGVENKAQAGV